MAMLPLRRRALLGATLGPLAAAPAISRAADTWPSRPVRLIVGYPPGSPTDLCARVLAEDMRTRLGQPVLVENRPGANGSLGAAFVAAAEPDGHTLLLSNTSTMTVNHLLYRDIRYDPLKDLLPVASLTLSPFFLTASPKSPRSRAFRDVAGLVAAAKADPGSLVYGSAGNGNLQHLYMEQWAGSLGLRLLHAPFRGAALEALATSSKAEVVAAYAERLVAERSALGWRSARSSSVREVFHDDPAWSQLIADDAPTTLHVFSGFRCHPAVRSALACARQLCV